MAVAVSNFYTSMPQTMIWSPGDGIQERAVVLEDSRTSPTGLFEKPPRLEKRRIARTFAIHRGCPVQQLLFPVMCSACVGVFHAGSARALTEVFPRPQGSPPRKDRVVFRGTTNSNGARRLGQGQRAARQSHRDAEALRKNYQELPAQSRAPDARARGGLDGETHQRRFRKKLLRMPGWGNGIQPIHHLVAVPGATGHR